jgi:hypothetical protein
MISICFLYTTMEFMKIARIKDIDLKTYKRIL